jgi:hypothetical protein
MACYGYISLLYIFMLFGNHRRHLRASTAFYSESSIFLRIVSSGMLPRVALVRTDVSEEPSASFIRVTGIGLLGTTLAATINRRTLRRNARFLRNLSSYKSHTA